VTFNVVMIDIHSGFFLLAVGLHYCRVLIKNKHLCRTKSVAMVNFSMYKGELMSICHISDGQNSNWWSRITLISRFL